MALFPDVDAVLFDLDGTLIDSAPDLGGAADSMRVQRGLPSLPMSQYRPMAGAGARGMLSVAFNITPEDPQFIALRDEFFTHYEKRMTQNTTIFDGVPQLIDYLVQQNIAWGVVTNKTARFTDPLTQAMPLFSTAGTIVSGDTTPHSKPHPAPLIEALRRINCPPERCLYVGDDHRDIQAGHAAGMRTVAATYGYLGVMHEVDHWGAHAQIDTPLALIELITSVKNTKE